VRTVKHQCPDCGEAFPTAEEAKDHWMKSHWQASSLETSEVAADADTSQRLDTSNVQDSDQSTTRTVVKHVCPTCSAEFPSLSEVRDHWLREHAKRSAEPEGEDGIKTVGAALQTKDAVQVVSCDDSGRAQVLRQMDDDGSKYTVVMNDDGTKEIFTETRVSSMATMEEDDVAQWMRDVPNLQLRGFVHEATERVVEGSQKYHARRADLQKLGDRMNFAYFGLDSNATAKELEVKYRQLAKKMHPDKNGGTETAKERFQMMKRRYEQLKERLREGVQGGTQDDVEENQVETACSTAKEEEGGGKQEHEEVLQWEDAGGDVIGFKRLGDCLFVLRTEDDAEAEPAHIVALSLHEENGDVILSAVDSRGVELRCCVPANQQEALESMWSRCKPEQAKHETNHRREAYDEDEEATAEEEEADMLQCDFSSRDSMEKMAWRMLRQLKSIKTQMDILDTEFRRIESVAPSC